MVLSERIRLEVSLTGAQVSVSSYFAYAEYAHFARERIRRFG